MWLVWILIGALLGGGAVWYFMVKRGWSFTGG